MGVVRVYMLDGPCELERSRAVTGVSLPVHTRAVKHTGYNQGWRGAGRAGHCHYGTDVGI